GRFTRSADFNPSKRAVLTLNALGRDDAFVVELTGGGKFGFARRFGGEALDYTERDSGEDIALDSSGNIYVTGSFARSIDFDTGSGTQTITSFGETDIFLLKLNSSGEVLWASHMGGERHDGGGDIAVG